MSKALIITSYVEHLNDVNLNYDEFHIIICADGGLKIAKDIGVTPDFFIGDFDSLGTMKRPNGKNVIVLSTEKDLTDSEAAIDFAISEGFDDILILGGLGGRLDHTMGNLGILAKYSSAQTRVMIMDGQNCVFMVSPGSIEIPRQNYKYLGIISHSNSSLVVSLKGVKYPLENFVIHNNTTLGVSNEIVDDTAHLILREGLLLVILTKDK